MARLVWRQAGGKTTSFTLSDSTLLGREPGVDCRLDARSVSRRHARIERRGSDFFLIDLGSMNGTLVNGTAIEGELVLHHGDQVQLGEETLELDLEEPAEGPTRGSMVTEPLSRSAQGGLRTDVAVSLPGREILPRRLGKFYLLRKLGQGGMGVVYRAIDLDSNREVAVKFIRAHIGRNEAFLDFFHNREAVLAREIEHPNVITVYEHGVGADQHYISMEYVPGESLYQVTKRRRCEPVEVMEILRQIACGLSAAHRHGVVHSDIKPANILLVGSLDADAEGVNAPSPSSGGSNDGGGILEFLGEIPQEGDTDSKSARYDRGLLEEIRKRVGEPARDVILDPPYFQRVSEMGFLEHYFDRIHEGKGYVLLVEGDSGTGKDRLISEFLSIKKCVQAGLSESREEGSVPIYEFDCSRIEGLPLLYEQVLGSRPPMNMHSRSMLDELTAYLAENPSPRIFRILNLGSATQLACDLIALFAHSMERQGLLLIASLDPEQMRKNGLLKPMLEKVSLVTKELYLRPLTEYQIQRYLQQLFPEVLSGTELASDLYRLCRGNFAKLLEILRGFFERGILSVDRPSGRLEYRPRVQEFELEEGKNLYAKYRAHGKVEQRILEQAAFIGPVFVFDTLLSLNDINETSLFFIIRTLVAEGFFVDERRGWYTFSNTAFQNYLAERMPLSERTTLHRRISRLLGQVSVPDSPELHQLEARHLAGCREYGKAVQHLLEGAYLARNEYKVDLFRDLFQEILRIYRMLSRQEPLRKEVTGVLRDWFHRDGNWYEILGELGSEVPRPTVKITDFGISFREKDNERGYQVEKRPVLGTPRYIAPERAKGEYGGFKSDIFALGVITYELAAGEPPFPDLRGNDVVQANRDRDIALPPDVLKKFPSAFEALLTGMLEKDPARRWDAERVIREVMKIQFDMRLASAARRSSS